MVGSLKVKSSQRNAEGLAYTFQGADNVVAIVDRKDPVEAGARPRWHMVVVAVIECSDSTEPRLDRLLLRIIPLVGLQHVVLRRSTVGVIKEFDNLPPHLIPLRIEMVECRAPFEVLVN